MFRSKLVLASMIVVFLACSQVQATLIESHWSVCGEGRWEDGVNWSPAFVPDNNDYGQLYTFDVVIDPEGDLQYYDEVEVGLTDSYTINKLDCYGQVDLESWDGWHRLTLDDLFNHGYLEIEWIEIIGDVTNLTGATLELCDMDIEGNLYNREGATIGVEYEVWVDKLEFTTGGGELFNDGTIEIYPMSELYAEGSFDNFGKILIYDGVCGGDAYLSNLGLIEGFGIVYGEEHVWNVGQIIASGGSLVVVSEGPLTNKKFMPEYTCLLRNEPLSSLQIKPWLHTEPADVNNHGIIEVNAGGGVAFDCNLVNYSDIELLGGTLAATTITQKADAEFSGFGSIATNKLWIETGAKIELNGPTNIIGNVTIASGGTLVISAGQTLITGHTTNNGTIVQAGGTVVSAGGLSGYGNIINATPDIDGLIGHWQMDDNAANTLVDDSSDYDNDGTAQQTTDGMSTVGIVGDALSFNGIGDYIDIGSNPIPSSGDWTLAGWVYCDGAHSGTTDDWAYAFGSASWSGTAVQGIALRWDVIMIGDGSSYTYKAHIPQITTSNANKWYHVAMVYDSVSEQTKVYVNGAYSFTINQAYAQSTINFTIGRSLRLTASRSFWYGKIDNVMIFNKALTDSQIEEVYKEVVFLAGHWKLDDYAASTVVKDSSNRGNDGTAQQTTDGISTAGKVGGALSFNGIDDYIDIGSNPMPSSGDWTLAGWVYCDGARGTTDDWAYAFGSASWSGTAFQGIALRRDIIIIGDGSSHTYKACIVDITGVNANKWYHVAMVYDSVSEQTKVYVDGAYSFTINQAYAQSTVNFTIGRSLRLTASRSFWYGKIDNVMIFNKALTDSQIEEVYNE